MTNNYIKLYFILRQYKSRRIIFSEACTVIKYNIRDNNYCIILLYAFVLIQVRRLRNTFLGMIVVCGAISVWLRNMYNRDIWAFRIMFVSKETYFILLLSFINKLRIIYYSNNTIKYYSIFEFFFSVLEPLKLYSTLQFFT